MHNVKRVSKKVGFTIIFFVLLVGDGTSDPRRYNPTSSETYIPPYLAEVDPWIGETAADNLFVAVDGEDSLPDMLIGRLPVNDIAELNTVVSKIVRYETQPEFGIWQHRATLIADNADTAGNFPFLSELLLQKFPSPPFSPQRLYYSPSEDTEDDEDAIGVNDEETAPHALSHMDVQCRCL